MKLKKPIPPQFIVEPGHSYYKLDKNNYAIPYHTLWRPSKNLSIKHVAQDLLANETVHISTVFLSINHSHSDDAPPLIFETMVFGGIHDDEQERYTTWTEAEEGHKAMVEKVKKTLHLMVLL